MNLHNGSGLRSDSALVVQNNSSNWSLLLILLGLSDSESGVALPIPVLEEESRLPDPLEFGLQSNQTVLILLSMAFFRARPQDSSRKSRAVYLVLSCCRLICSTSLSRFLGWRKGPRLEGYDFQFLRELCRFLYSFSSCWSNMVMSLGRVGSEGGCGVAIVLAVHTSRGTFGNI